MADGFLAQGIGRRKEAVARIRVIEGKGQITVNGKPIGEVFRGPFNQKLYQRPFEATKTLGQYTATAKVKGGGTVSQLEAIVLGLARSLGKISPEFHRLMRDNGLLTVDARVRERRKYGLAHAARAKKQSPKR